MARQILVFLRRDEKMEEVIPCIEKIARPGMKIVFLVHSAKDGFASIDDCQIGPGPEVETTLGSSGMAQAVDLQQQKRLTEEKVLPACRRLLKMGVGVGVDVYTGSLRKSLGRYTSNGDVDVLMMPAGLGLKVMKFLHGRFSYQRLFQATAASPMFVSYGEASGAAHARN
jgi:hypothetical protein